MHEAVKYIHDHGAELKAEAPKGDELGKLTDRTVEILRESQGMKLLLAKDLGGLEAHPNDFLDWAMAVGEYQPSAGWIAGVVGVHPFEISVMHPKLQQEIFGDDPDVWTASPYAPFGRAIPVDGGFRFTGRWPFSTGTDHSDWVILGGMVADEQGNPVMPPDIRHFVLPRGDYEIVEDSWNVLGLKGTGSKDVQMTDVFVPDYRVVSGAAMSEGEHARERRPGTPLFQIPFGTIFPAAISAGTFGITRAAVKAFTEHMASRVSVQGTVAKTEPTQLATLAKAEADVEASICHFKSLIAQMYDAVCDGHVVTPEERLKFRADQVRSTDRAIQAVDELFRLAGSSSINEGQDIERIWRDLHVAATHICNVREPAYAAWGQARFGGQVPPGALY